jgi:hypothetical protein
MKLYKITLILIIGLAIASCQDEYENELIPGSELSGEWYVETSVDGMVVLGHEKIATYNTSAADGSQIWVDDLEHIWPVKAKISASPSSNSFAGMGDNIVAPIYSYDTADIAEPYDSITSTFEGYHTMEVLEGKVINDAGRSKSGVVTDSIYIKAVFSDDPGTEYEMAGHRRTGFLEDDY